MAKLLSKKEVETLTPGELADKLADGFKLVDAAIPIVTTIVNNISEWAQNLAKDKLSLPAGKKKAILALQEVSRLQQELLIKQQAQITENRQFIEIIVVRLNKAQSAGEITS